MQAKIAKVTRKLEKSIPKAQDDPRRPRYHFVPPANWMNDPNGTIFHNGDYHLFYQFNPAKPKWGNLHWGHAKSKDLVHWEHLPIALAPNGFPGEVHCWSGCCVIADDGTPMIFYTSMNARSLLLTRARRYAQQWMVTGSPDLLTWQKSPHNPVLSEAIHGDQIPQHWRDPYIWKEDERWLMVLGGESLGEKSGCVFLYQSQNLLDWEYVGVLAQEESVRGKGWECPNYVRLGDKYVLVISPYGPVIYSVGEFDGQRHHSDGWQTLDHGEDFYATNTFLDDQGRTIIVGWVKAKGDGWAGCLSLPRQLDLLDDSQLSIQPISELQQLRQSHVDYERTLETVVEEAGTGAFFGERIEIKARFELQQAQSFGIKLIDDADEHELAFDFPTEILQAFGEQIQLQFTKDANRIDLHIFIDHSVIEIFINQREAFTTTFYPKLADTHTLKVAPFVKQAKGCFSVDFWRLAETPNEFFLGA